MKKLCTVPSTMKHCVGTVDVVEWEHGDPFPELGPSVGVDTETELITDTMLDPPVVVLGVFDPASMTCYVVYWYDVCEFMQQLNKRDIQQRYFNLGFDEQVLDNEDPEKTLLTAIDQNRVIDMQIRVHLRELATLGFIRYNMHSLAGCTLELLNYKLDKGDGTEDSARLSFKRYNPDGTKYRITEEQACYLPFDCISTWCIGEEVPPCATEEAHTKGMVVLAHISANGTQVDPVVFDAFEKRLKAARDVYRNELVAYGFPDPYSNASDEAKNVKEALLKNYADFLRLYGIDPAAASLEEEAPPPSKNALRRAAVYMYACADGPEDSKQTAQYLKAVFEASTGLRKSEKETYLKICEDYGVQSIDQSGKATAMQAYVGKLLENYIQQFNRGDAVAKGYDFEEANTFANDYLDDNPGLLETGKRVGPREFFQSHVLELLLNNGKNGMTKEGILKAVEEERAEDAAKKVEWTASDKMERLISYSKINLELTEKSGEAKLTLKDMWRLEDANIQDKFLSAYTNYGHCVKYLSTYMNRSFIKSDSKVHPRYVSILRTARTSCNGPNIQQLPSKDKTFPLKLMYRAFPGMVMCATDFSFVELCAFGQACYTRFGHSVMRDVINAGLDPHRWFAGVMNKVITPDLRNANDPEWVDKTNKYLEENISKEKRNLAKMANFGLPGGMGYEAFYKHCREGGLLLTPADTNFMRDAWINTFTEMQEHMQPIEIPSSSVPKSQYGYQDPDEPVEEEVDEKGPRRRYKAVCINGFVRNNASKNAACNAQFQSLVAYGAKLAGWNLLYKGGLGDRLTAFIHDEYVYCLRPDELEEKIPLVEALMLEGMRIALPDVKVGVESSCSLHWDKGATEFTKLQRDPDGRYIIEDPQIVTDMYNEAGLTYKI